MQRHSNSFRQSNRPVKNKILSIEEGVITAEPGVTFSDLVTATQKTGQIPPVTPEFRGITLGGAFSGAALESSSHLYGQVSDQILSAQILLKNGNNLICSPTEHSDLFYGLSGAYGTLGEITKLQMKLIQAPKSVHVRVQTVNNLEQVLRAFDTPYFVEALALHGTTFLVIKAEMCDELAPSIKSKYYFYERVMNSSSFIMSLEEYLFRHDYGAFWMGRHLFDPKIAYHFLTRRTKRTFPLWINQPRKLRLPSLLSSQALYKILHKIPQDVFEQLFLIHDFYLPQSQFEKGFQKMYNKTKLSPIWLCPVRNTQTAQIFSPHFAREPLVNIGLYGIPPIDLPLDAVGREIEEESHLFCGRKMLYSICYFSKSLFEKIYDLEAYDKLRERYGASGSMTLFEKISRRDLHQ